jgi:23S rRNA U2552 (ribose-2'-O)-methylase RlmE/FtsJ
MTSYRLVDERTVAVTVGAAPCSWTRVTNVAESNTQVRVRVETLPCPIPLPQSDAQDLREITVLLTNDLGNRTVTDAQGQAIPMRQAGP